jgi:soluble lytic murein transglycosylase-like protein
VPIIILLALSGAIFLVSQSSFAGENMSGKRLFDLPDIDSDSQGGNFKTDYDTFFESVADESGVPFALLKAHAIQESSLNPRAFQDENPRRVQSRQGWASRGLMQILWWPGSNRFLKYGFPDSELDSGEKLYEPYTNISIGAKIIAQNLKACGGDIRDAVNMYNTGKKESELEAPANYVDKVTGYYSKLIGKDV